MKTINQVQAELIWASFQPAVARLNNIASRIEGTEGVAQVSVCCPPVEEIEDDLAEGELRVPTLDVETYRDAPRDLALEGLTKIGDGTGEYGTISTFAL